MSRVYKIRDFAAMAGVTVKALHHYDRLGLLKPERTPAGYRVYRERHLETLEQIIALKFLGLPLREIEKILKRPALEMADTLRLQRRALEDRQELLARAIRSIRAAEEAIAAGNPADPAMLKNIIEAIEMQDGIGVMKKYYSEESWERHRRYYEEGPSEQWQDFYRDGHKLLGGDPASAEAQKLVERWLDLSQRAHAGDPAVATDSPAAWIDRANWPRALKQRAGELRMEEVQAFVRRAALIRSRFMFSDEGWAKLAELQKLAPQEHTSQLKARVELFRDLEGAAEEDPAGERAQALVARWQAQLDVNSGGNPEIRAALLAGWSRRREWPDSHRWQVERLHVMSFERFERAADFLDRAVAAARKTEAQMTSLKSALLDEFEEEMAAARKMLEAVPEDRFAWRPHEKSMTLGRLASHVAMMPGVAAVIVRKRGPRPAEAESKKELMANFDANVAACREVFSGLSEEQLSGDILVTPTIEKPLWKVLQGRGFLNHMIHHRGQLSMYLRLVGAAVPGMYGPSADEK